MENVQEKIMRIKYKLLTHNYKTINSFTKYKKDFLGIILILNHIFENYDQNRDF